MNATTFEVHNTAQGFTTLNNYFLNDKNLSHKACGMLARILSLPKDWKINIKGLSTTFGGSKDQICGIFKELTKLGYMRMTKIKGENNLILRCHYDISDMPIYKEEEEIKQHEKPINKESHRYPDFQDPENQDPENRDPENQDVIKTKELKTKKPKTKRYNKNDFENFDYKDLSVKQRRCFVQLEEIGFNRLEAHKIASNTNYMLKWYAWKFERKNDSINSKYHFDVMTNEHKINSFKKYIKNTGL